MLIVSIITDQAQQKDSADNRIPGKYYPDYFDGKIQWDSDSGK